METTQVDSVITEVRAVRDGIAAESNYDVGAIFERIREIQDQSGREYVSYPARRVDGSTAGSGRRTPGAMAGGPTAPS